MKKDNSNDWNKNLFSWEFSQVAINNYLGWDVSEKDYLSPHHIVISIINGENKSSYDIAVEWDDVSLGYFYYRDFTKGGLPFVEEGETYSSQFIFQLKEDYLKFTRMYGIKGDFS